MSLNTSSLTQTLEQLKREIQANAADIQRKETELNNSSTEKQNLETSIRTKEGEIKQKEGEIQKLKTDIQLTKAKLSGFDRNTKKLADEISALKREQSTDSLQLQRIQRDLETAVREADKKKPFK